MKYTLLLVLVACSRLAMAQTTNTPTTQLGLYIWNTPMLMQPCNETGTPVDDDGDPVLGEGTPAAKIASLTGQKFRVIDVSNGKALLMILDYTSTKKNTDGAGVVTFTVEPQSNFYKYNFIGTTAQYGVIKPQDQLNRTYGSHQRYFTIDANTLSNTALVTKDDHVRGALTFGVLNFPFKYRPQTGHGDFSGAFNFGAAIGYKFPHHSYSPFTYSIVSGYSIANTVLDSASTTKNQGNLASSNNFTAFSLSFGGLVEYQKVQAGVFLGWDRISSINQREYGWVYQGRPWFSVGFGLAIFSTQTEKANTDQTTQSKN